MASKKKKKSGRLSQTEWEFIELHSEDMDPKEIAERLNRELDPIMRYLRKIGKTDDYEVQAEFDLKSRPVWKEIKKQFDESELEMFLYYWSKIVSQFQGDITPTEEMQIGDAVKLELLMNRALTEQRDSVVQATRLNELLNEFYREPQEYQQENREIGYNMEKQIAALKMSREAMTRDYKIFQEKKNAILKEMKATREQRVDKISSNKKTFEDIAKMIMTDPDWVRKKNREMEMMRYAVDAEKKRFGEYHEFGDGTIDQVFMSSDNVIIDENSA